MFATLYFKPAAHKDVLLIPSEAVIATGTRTIVMAARENGQFTPVEVEIGAESDGRTEIRKGLVAGERVVLSGQFLVDSEASLKGVTARQGGVSDGASGADEKRTYSGRGKVEAIGNGNVTLSIDPVPELHWKATTQRFQSPANGLPRNVEVGDSVGFVFRQDTAGQSTLTTITPIAPEPANATPAVPHAAGEKP
jgi:Cu(I)/Ag(I) efflux system membrane fusion protein